MKPGWSASLTGGGRDIGGKVCYTSSNSRTTTCGYASTSNGGTVGVSFGFRF